MIIFMNHTRSDAQRMDVYENKWTAAVCWCILFVVRDYFFFLSKNSPPMFVSPRFFFFSPHKSPVFTLPINTTFLAYYKFKRTTELRRYTDFKNFPLRGAKKSRCAARLGRGAARHAWLRQACCMPLDTYCIQAFLSNKYRLLPL